MHEIGAETINNRPHSFRKEKVPVAFQGHRPQLPDLFWTLFLQLSFRERSPVPLRLSLAFSEYLRLADFYCKVIIQHIIEAFSTD